jgi:hypothetical protein
MRLQESGRAVSRLKRWAPLLVLVMTACSDPWGPQFWNPAPQPVTLFSASRAEWVGMVSAIDLANEPVRAIAIEAPGATGNWDVVLVDGPNGLTLLPAESMDGLASRARIAVIEGVAFADLREAPRDTARYTAGPVSLRTDVVYVIRSRSAVCGYTAGVRYAKLQPVEIDQQRGIFRAFVVRNPFCDDRALVPPE